MKCNEFGDTCPDAEWCRQGGSCDAARRPGEQTPSKLLLGVPVSALFTAGTVAAIIAAVQGSLWWLALPVGAGAALVLILSRPYRRDEQLAQVVGLHELPSTDEVDLSHLETVHGGDRGLLDPVIWDNALWVDPDEEERR